MSSYTAALIESVNSRQSVANVDVMPTGAHGKTGEQIAELMAERARLEKNRTWLQNGRQRL